MREIPRKRYLLVGGAFVLAALFAVVGRSGGAAPKVEAATASKRSADPDAGGFSLSFGGDSGKRVEVLSPRRGPLAAWITAPGTIQAGSEVGIGAPFEGKVALLNKDDGDPVEEGELVFRLDPKDKQEQVTEAEIDLARKKSAAFEADIELQEARRLNAQADEEPEDLIEAKLQVRRDELEVERTAAQLQAAESRLARAQRLLQEGVGRQSDVEAAESEHKVSQISQRVAVKQLALAKDKQAFREKAWITTRAESQKALTLAESVHERAMADLKAGNVALTRAKRDLERCAVRSPLKGIITSRQVNSGEEVTRATGETSHYIISDLSRLLVYADVDEGDVVKVTRGQPAKVSVNALGSETTLKASVYDVGYRARTAQGEEVPFFRVRVLLDNTQERHEELRPGMTANVEIRVDHVKDALKVPIQAVVQRERKEVPSDLVAILPEALRAGLDPKLLAEDSKELLNVVFVIKNGKALVRVVKLGIQDQHEVQVLAGLEDDLPVAVGPYRVLDKLRHDAAVQPTESTDVVLPHHEEETATPEAEPPGPGDTSQPDPEKK